VNLNKLWQYLNCLEKIPDSVLTRNSKHPLKKSSSALSFLFPDSVLTSNAVAV